MQEGKVLYFHNNHAKPGSYAGVIYWGGTIDHIGPSWCAWMVPGSYIDE